MSEEIGNGKYCDSCGKYEMYLVNTEDPNESYYECKYCGNTKHNSP